MKRLFFVFAIMIVLSGCSASEQKESTTKPENINDSSYGWSHTKYSFYEDGILIKDDIVWVFDGEAKQMVPLCTRPECTHYGDSSPEYDGECPASYLAKRAAAIGVYENQIWYVHETGKEWEVWTADLTGENHKLQCKTERLENASPSGEDLFYDGFYYTIMSELLIDDETGETKFQTLLVSVDLKSGELQRLMEGTDPWQSLTLVGANTHTLFYSIVVEDETGILERNICGIDLNSREEMLVEVSCGSVVMFQNWLVYTERVDDISKVQLLDVLTGRRICVYETNDKIQYLDITNGRILFRDMVGEETYGPWHIYHIEKGDLYQLPVYEQNFANWLSVGDGWFLSLNVEPFVSEYYYIDEVDFIAGKEPTRVK